MNQTHAGAINAPTYVESIDGKRIGGQRAAVLRVMLSGAWLSLAEIEARTDYPQASISARLRDFRKAQYGGYQIDRRRREDGKGTWEYRLKARVSGQAELPF